MMAADAKCELTTVNDSDQPASDMASTEEGASASLDYYGVNAAGAPFLEPADRGRAAWLFLLGGFLVEMLSWAFQLSFGVLEDYYTSKTDFDRKLIPYIGTLAGGINYLACPIIIPLSTYKPHIRKPLMYTGLTMCAVGSIGSSFATNAWHLIMGQGVLYGMGVAILYLPIFGMLFEWFDEKRGFAAGIMFAGGGMAGVAFPFAFEWTLDTHGSAFALRAWATTLILLLLPTLYLTRSRRVAPLAPPWAPRKPHAGVWRFLRSARFWFFASATIFQGLGFFLPTIWIPTYATGLGLSTHAGTALQTILNISCVAGQVLVGFVSDRARVDIALLLGAWQLATAATVFAGWGCARAFPALAWFAVLYGLFAGGHSSFWSRLAQAVAAPHDELSASLAFGAMSGGRGVGYLLSGTLSNALLGLDADVGVGLRPYGPLILFAGTAFVIAAGGALGRVVRS